MKIAFRNEGDIKTSSNERKQNLLIIYFIHEQFKLLINCFILFILNLLTQYFQFSELSTRMNLSFVFFPTLTNFYYVQFSFESFLLQVVIMDGWFVIIIWLIHERM